MGSLKKHQPDEAEIQALLAKETIMRVHPQMDHYTNRLFVILKKDGLLRPVVILNPLNWFMANHHFKMEGIC